MKRMFLVVLALSCAACAPVVTKVNIPDIGKSDAVPVTDMRPATERASKIFSVSIFSKQYGIYRVGDDALSPPTVKLFQYQVAKQTPAGETPPKVTVYHFVVYKNLQSQLRHTSVGLAIGGVVGGLIGGSMNDHGEMSHTRVIDEKTFDSLAAEEYQRGVYTKTEDPNKVSVFIVYIETGINGKRVFTRTIATALQKGKDNPLVDAVQMAIRNQLAIYHSGATDAKGAVAPDKAQASGQTSKPGQA